MSGKHFTVFATPLQPIACWPISSHSVRLFGRIDAQAGEIDQSQRTRVEIGHEQGASRGPLPTGIVPRTAAKPGVNLAVSITVSDCGSSVMPTSVTTSFLPSSVRL